MYCQYLMEMPFSEIREYHNGNCDCSRKLLKSTRFGAKNHSFSLLPRAKLVTTLKPPPFKEGGSLTFASPLAAKCRTMASSYHLQRDDDYICMGNEFCRKKWRTFLKRETLSISPQGDFCPFVSKSAPQGVQTFFRPKTFFPYSDLGYKYASLPLSNSRLLWRNEWTLHDSHAASIAPLLHFRGDFFPHLSYW